MKCEHFPRPTHSVLYNEVNQRERERLPLVVGERTPAFPPSISTAAKPEERC